MRDALCGGGASEVAPFAISSLKNAIYRPAPRANLPVFEPFSADSSWNSRRSGDGAEAAAEAGARHGGPAGVRRARAHPGDPDEGSGSQVPQEGHGVSPATAHRGREEKGGGRRGGEGARQARRGGDVATRAGGRDEVRARRRRAEHPRRPRQGPSRARTPPRTCQDSPSDGPIQGEPDVTRERPRAGRDPGGTRRPVARQVPPRAGRQGGAGQNHRRDAPAVNPRGCHQDDDRRRRRSRTLPRGEQRIGRISGGVWIVPRALDARGATPAGSREGRERHGDGEDRRAEGAGRRRELRGEDATRQSRGGARGHLKRQSPRADFDGIGPAVAVPARSRHPRVPGDREHRTVPDRDPAVPGIDVRERRRGRRAGRFGTEARPAARTPGSHDRGHHAPVRSSAPRGAGPAGAGGATSRRGGQTREAGERTARGGDGGARGGRGETVAAAHAGSHPSRPRHRRARGTRHERRRRR